MPKLSPPKRAAPATVLFCWTPEDLWAIVSRNLIPQENTMAKKIKGKSGYKKKTIRIAAKKTGKGKHKGYSKTVWVKKKK